MTGMPAALIAAVKESRDRESSAGDRAASSRIQRGDLRFANGVAGSDAEPRLVLVLSVDSRLDFAEVLLVHTAVEMACDVDAIVPVAVSGAPYAVVVETDLRGAVWTLQLSPEVGHLDETVITALAPGHEVSTAGPASGVSHGIRLAGPVDPRWGFKADEGAAFRSLTRDCTDALLDEGEWLVAPELLRPDLLDLAADPPALIAELVHWVKTRRLDIGISEIETLLELGALDLDAWAAVGDLGLDVWTTIQTLVERSATAPRDRGKAPLRIVTAVHLQAQVWSAEPDAIHYLGQKEHAPA